MDTEYDKFLKKNPALLLASACVYEIQYILVEELPVECSRIFNEDLENKMIKALEDLLREPLEKLRGLKDD